MGCTADEKKKVKAEGFLFNRGSENLFSGRIITGNGTLTAEELAVVAEAAQKFGNGRVAFTTRLTVELPGVAFENIAPMQAFLAEHGLYTGGTGDKIRPVSCCKGTTCIFGQADTQALAQEIHERFFEGWKEVALPHKFKIAVGGCPNNCMKPDLNDFGLVGTRVPAVKEELCRGCKKCVVEAGCQMKAPKLVDGHVTIDKERCNACGKCIAACPFKCLESQAHGLTVLIGGKWGRMRRPANRLPGVYDVAAALELLEKSLLLFKKHAYAKERFGDMLDRIGVDQAEQELLSDSLLAEKETILAAPVAARP